MEVDFSDHARLGWEETARLAADLAAHAASSAGGGGGGVVICEVGMDPGTGCWFYKGLRPDKDRPNDLKTVLSTLMELAENVGAEELEARLLAADSPAGDTWEADRAAQAAVLLEQQRRRTTEARAETRLKKRKP